MAGNRTIFGGLLFFGLVVAVLTLAIICSRERRSLLGGGLVVNDVTSAVRAVKIIRAQSGLKQGGWIRLRIIAVPGLGTPDASAERVVETRKNLLWLKERNIRICALIRLPLNDWSDGSLSTNLGLIHTQAKRLAAIYGDAVTAWEIDNEPDLGFVQDSAETYTTFLKAVYLGLKAGSTEQEARSQDQAHESGFSFPGSKKAPLVIMGSLGLPPGPWLERFAANDGFAYTDGFNYHYYGYADDFTGVYRQHERAVAELIAALLKAETGRRLGADGEAKMKAEGSDKSSILGTNPQLSAFSSQLSPASVQKNLPVFLTEVGYGMLGKSARDTKEGRLRQWRWFRSVGEQAADLRIEAPMAFVLPPYLEYDSLEFGLTVPADQRTEDGGQRTGSNAFRAGGINYDTEDFGAKSVEPWMEMIGKPIGGNEVTPALAQWLGVRSAHRKAESGKLKAEDSKAITDLSSESRSWTVTTAAPSPVVIDFITGEGLSFVKRYNGSFVIGTSPEVGRVIPNAPAQQPAPKPQTPDTKSKTLPVRAEEFMIHVRTRNGNLYEVYPTRVASPDWQTYQEPHDNFTMAFYGRAELPWRFKDNQPASLVVVMYPKQLPAVYEFRGPRLVRLSEPQKPETGRRVGEDGEANLNPEVFRFGQGKVILYNFSDKPVAGRLQLPEVVGRVSLNAPDSDEVIILQPGERQEISISIKVPWGVYQRIEAPITFLPEDKTIPPARFLTAFLPDIGGLRTTVAANLTSHLAADFNNNMDENKKVGRVDSSAEAPREGRIPNGPNNRELILVRPRAAEEAPMFDQGHFFAQQGATVERTTDGFTVTVTELPPGKEKRVEVEIPWPDGLGFAAEDFLSMDFRLGGAR